MVNPKIRTEIIVTTIDRMDSRCLNDCMPMNKLIRPITKQVIAPNTLFIFTLHNV